MPRQFSFRGDRLAYSLGDRPAGRRSRPLLLVGLRRRHDAADPALLGRRVRVLHAVADRAWSATGSRPRSRGWWWRMAVNAFGAVLTLVVLVDRRRREVPRRRLPRRDPDPDPRRDDAVHPPPVRARRRGSWRSGPTYVVTPPHREERAIVPVPGSTGRSSRPSTWPARSPTRSRRSTSPTTPRRRPRCASEWERQVPGVPLVDRRVALPRAGRAAARLPRRPRPRVAARQAGADHVRRHARVRRAALVGADPLQPVGEAAADRRCSAGRTRSIVDVPYRREDAGRFKAAEAAGSGDGDDDGDAAAGPHAAGTAVPVAEPGRPAGTGRGGRRRLSRGAVYRDAARRPVEARPRSPLHRSSLARRLLVRGQFGDTAVPARRRGALRWTHRSADRGPRGQAGEGRPGRARRHPRRRDRLDAAARRGRGRTIRGRPAGPRHRRDHRRGRPLPDGDRAAPGARRRGGDRRRGDRARRRPRHRRAAVPAPVRRRLRHRAHYSLHPEERPVRRLGDPRGHARGAA